MKAGGPRLGRRIPTPQTARICMLVEHTAGNAQALAAAAEEPSVSDRRERVEWRPQRDSNPIGGKKLTY